MGDLYIWNQREGLRRLLSTTRSRPILIEEIAWSSDSRWIAARMYPSDCRRRGEGEGGEITRCERVALIDAQTGKVAYRTPAGLKPNYVGANDGKLVITTEPFATTDDFLGDGFLGGLGGGGGLVRNWFELDADTLTLTPSASHHSADGANALVPLST